MARITGEYDTNGGVEKGSDREEIVVAEERIELCNVLIHCFALRLQILNLSDAVSHRHEEQNTLDPFNLLSNISSSR